MVWTVMGTAQLVTCCPVLAAVNQLPASEHVLARAAVVLHVYRDGAITKGDLKSLMRQTNSYLEPVALVSCSQLLLRCLDLFSPAFCAKTICCSLSNSCPYSKTQPQPS